MVEAIISKDFEDALERFRGMLLASNLSDEAKRGAMEIASAAVEAARAQAQAAKHFRALVQPASDSHRLKLSALLDRMVSEVLK